MNHVPVSGIPQRAVPCVPADRLQEDVTKLLEIVRDGNGDSLVSRVIKIEKDVESILDKMEGQASFRRQVALAFIGALIGFGASLATMLVK